MKSKSGYQGIVKDKEFIALEKLKNQSLQNLSNLKKEVVFDQIFNRDVFYVRSYKLFTESKLTKKQFKAIQLPNKFKLPNIETHFITMNESLYPNHYSDGLLYNNWNTINRTMNNETYVPKKPKNLTKIKITKKFSNNKQNNILYKDNPIYRMIVSKPKVNTISLTLKNRKGH